MEVTYAAQKVICNATLLPVPTNIQDLRLNYMTLLRLSKQKCTFERHFHEAKFVIFSHRTS